MATARGIASTTFRSLRTRNYRLFFVGQGISLCGTWMQTIALGWLVLQLSHNSGIAIGAVIALQFVPTLFLGAWAGVLSDRFDKRVILILTAITMTVTAGTLAILTLTGIVSLWMVFVIVLLQGLAQSIDNPARLSFVSEMTGPADLPNAIGLNSALFQVARIVGPAFAGVLIVLVGTGWCFALNAVSYVAVIGALMAMDVNVLHRHPPVARAKGQVREGLRYIRETPELRSILLMTLVVGTLAINFPVVLPLIAKVTFDGNAATYSWMTVSMGVGALAGALAVAHKSNPTARVVVGERLRVRHCDLRRLVRAHDRAVRLPGGVRGRGPDHVPRHLPVDGAARSRTVEARPRDGRLLDHDPRHDADRRAARGLDQRAVRPALRPRDRRHRHPRRHPVLRAHPAARPAPRPPRRTGVSKPAHILVW